MPDRSDSRDNIPENSGPNTDRRTFLKAAGLAGIAGAFADVAHASSGIGPVAQAQQSPTSWKPMTAGTASAQKWWPSKWGAADELGASNHITPQKVLDAAKWIRDGKVYRLGRVYERACRCSGTRIHVAHPRRADRRPVRRKQAGLS